MKVLVEEYFQVFWYFCNQEPKRETEEKKPKTPVKKEKKPKDIPAVQIYKSPGKFTFLLMLLSFIGILIWLPNIFSVLDLKNKFLNTLQISLFVTKQNINTPIQ